MKSMVRNKPKQNGRELRKRLNKFTHLKKPKKLKKDSRIKKVSDIKPDVLWGLK